MSEKLFELGIEENVDLSEQEITTRYKWVTEPNACKKCKKLEGKIFNSKEEFEAARPHPHCKCSYEIIQENPEETNTRETELQPEPEQEQEPAEYNADIEYLKTLNEMGAYSEQQIKAQEEKQKEIEERAKNMQILQRKKIMNQIELREYVSRLERKALEQKNKLESALISLKMAKEFVREKISKLDKDMKLALNELNSLAQKIEITIQKTTTVIVNLCAILEIPIELELRKNIDNDKKEAKLNQLQASLDYLIQTSSEIFPEASNLWKLSNSKLNDNTEYIENNGKLLNSFIDVDEPSLRTKVKTKIESQHMSLKSRGVRFRYDSSLADSLIKSHGLKTYIRQNRDKFKPNTTLPDASLALFFPTFNDVNLYFGIHNTDIKDIYIDFYGRFTAKIVDTYDFNDKEYWPPVWQANVLQHANKIENYFVIVDIVIPKDIWENY